MSDTGKASGSSPVTVDPTQATFGYDKLTRRDLIALCKARGLKRGRSPTCLILVEILEQDDLEKAKAASLDTGTGGNPPAVDPLEEEDDDDLDEDSDVEDLGVQDQGSQVPVGRLSQANLDLLGNGEGQHLPRTQHMIPPGNRRVRSPSGDSHLSSASRESERGMSASQKAEHRARMRAVRLQIEREEVALSQAKLTLAQAKLALAREQKLSGLDVTGGSNFPREKDRAYDNRNLTKIVPPFKEGDDIHKWMTALERACMVQQVPENQWAAILWYSFSEKGRDRLLTVRPEDAKNYSVLKSALIEGYGLTTEQYRLLFRDTQKAQTQDWTDFVECATKALEGWLQGSKVSDYTGLYNLMMREQILNNCTNQLLHQYLIDSDLTSPQELGKKADKWVRTRIKQKPQNQGGDQKKTDQKGGNQNQKDKEKDQKSSGPQTNSKEGGSQTGNKKKKNKGPKTPWCNTCKSVSHWGSECTKANPVPTTTAPKATATPSTVF
ncbi:uncharacterized protein LOC144806177 [Lissotriton helveticus]